MRCAVPTAVDICNMYLYIYVHKKTYLQGVAAAV